MNLLKRFWWLLLILFLVGGGTLLFRRIQAGREVKTVRIERGEVVEELELSGEVKAVEHAKLGFLTAGRLAWIGVKEGEGVSKGQLLAYLDTTVLRTAVIAAENAYLAADVAAKKAEDDVKGHAADETFAQKNTRVAAQTARDTAYFELVAARQALKNAYINAPFAGLVTMVANPFAGVNVTAAATQIELLNPASIYFSVTADQTEVSRLKTGLPVKLVLDSFDDQEFAGQISEIGLTPEPGASGTVYEVKIGFDQIPEGVRIGMTGDISLVVARTENALFVPPQYLNSDTQGKYLRLDESGTSRVYVELGVEGEDRVEVKGDVSEGQLVYD